MAESAALLVDEVLPHQPMRQWVLSFPYQLRFLFASRPELMGKVLDTRVNGYPIYPVLGKESVILLIPYLILLIPNGLHPQQRANHPL